MNNKHKHILKPFYPKTKLGSVVISLLLLVPIVTLCFFSIVDKDKKISEKENRNLNKMSDYSYSAMVSGELEKEFDGYYTDHFPFRDFFLKVNQKTRSILTQSKGEDDIVILEGVKPDDFKGQDVD